MECRIKFIGKEFHDKKTFDTVDKALDFIERHSDKIDSVNSQPIQIYQFLDLEHTRMMTREELRDLLIGRDPFARTFYNNLRSLK